MGLPGTPQSPPNSQRWDTEKGGVRQVQIVSAIVESAQTGRVVQIESEMGPVSGAEKEQL